MGRKSYTEITTQDTNETFVFDKERKHKGIYELEMKVWGLNKAGNREAWSDPGQTVTFHLTEKTMIDAGCKAVPIPERTENPVESMEELALRFLEHLGVYPQE